MTIKLGAELMPFVESLEKVLSNWSLDPVIQQQVIELLCVRHCLAASTARHEALFVADGLHKHVTQLIVGATDAKGTDG